MPRSRRPHYPRRVEGIPYHRLEVVLSSDGSDDDGSSWRQDETPRPSLRLGERHKKRSRCGRVEREEDANRRLAYWLCKHRTLHTGLRHRLYRMSKTDAAPAKTFARDVSEPTSSDEDDDSSLPAVQRSRKTALQPFVSVSRESVEKAKASAASLSSTVPTPSSSSSSHPLSHVRIKKITSPSQARRVRDASPVSPTPSSSPPLKRSKKRAYPSDSSGEDTTDEEEILRRPMPFAPLEDDDEYADPNWDDDDDERTLKRRRRVWREATEESQSMAGSMTPQHVRNGSSGFDSEVWDEEQEGSRLTQREQEERLERWMFETCLKAARKDRSLAYDVQVPDVEIEQMIKDFFDVE